MRILTLDQDLLGLVDIATPDLYAAVCDQALDALACERIHQPRLSSRKLERPTHRLVGEALARVAGVLRVQLPHLPLREIAHGQRLGLDVDAAEDVSILAQPVKAGGLVIPNSLAVHPMEGCDGDSQGRPGKLTVRRYERFAAGGAGLRWRTIVGALVLVVLGFAAYLLNDALTAFMLGLNSLLLFIFAVVVATLTGAALGALIEATMIRPLYERHTYQIMMTFGLAFIGTEAVIAIWGRSGFTMPRPSLFATPQIPVQPPVLGAGSRTSAG